MSHRTRTKEYSTLRSILDGTCENVPESPCCVLQKDDTSQVLTYRAFQHCLVEHEACIRKTVQSFIGEDSSCEDIVVAFLSSNSIDMLLAMLACTNVETTVAALLNIRWTASEMSIALKSKNPKAITILLYGPGFESVAHQVVSQIGHKSSCVPIRNVSTPFLQQPRELSWKMRALDKRLHSVSERMERTKMEGSDQDAMIVFTSGTTGGSKGVRLSHCALAIQAFAKLDDPCGYSAETAMLASTVPLFHVGGLSSCLAVLFAGGSLIFPNSSNKGFDVRVVKQSLENPFLAANTLVVVPAMLVALFGSDERTKARRKTYLEVRLILIGGQSASGPLVQKIERTFPNARIVQTYACTEAASSLTFMYVNSKDVSKGIVKKPVPNGDCVGTTPAHVNIRLYKRNESGKVWNILSLPFEPGVIATRGPHLMNGYWQRGATQQQNRSGWFLTNDLGFFDNDGKLYFCGRAKDTIRTGGETVLAQEVERVLLHHPDISECAVFPRLDERFGEAVACAIVATRQSLQLGAIKEWCQEHGLASYKRPRYLFLVDELPKNTSGKILKHKLVQLYGDRVTSKL